MASQNQGNTNKVYTSFAYDHASYVVRQSRQLAANAAGATASTGKFNAHAALIVYGVTFTTTTAGTSTYTVNGTATAQATQFNAIYVTNTATGSVALATTTVGPFTIGGTTTTGSNVNVLGLGGGVAGGFTGPYALNTLGGTNTSMVWGSATFTSGPPGGANAGLFGLPMSPGDTLTFTGGTDATAVVVPIVDFTLQPPGYTATGAQVIA